MFKRIILINMMIFVLFIVVHSEDDFYYSNNQQYQLTPMANRVVIGFEPTGFGSFSEIIAAYPEIIDSLEPERIGYAFYIYEIDTSANLDSLINDLNSDTLIVIAQHAFENNFGAMEAFNNNIVIKPED